MTSQDKAKTINIIFLEGVTFQEETKSIVMICFAGVVASMTDDLPFIENTLEKEDKHGRL